MKKYYNFLYAAMAVCIMLISCQEEKEEPIQLTPIPEGTRAFIEVNFNDSTYYLMEGVDSVYSAYTYLVPATDNGSAKILGATLCNDSSLVEFRFGYIQLDLSRLELIKYLTRAEQDLAYGYYEGEILKMPQTGFLMEVVELNFPQGPGVGYQTFEIQQPEEAFMRIGHYYSGETERSIWLEGSFRLELPYKYQGQLITGKFLLDLPLCCWN